MKEFKVLSDSELIAQLGDAVISERECLVLQLEIIMELDRRKLTLEYSTLKAFLVSEYHMPESDAERKIYAARILKRFPELKEKLVSGKLNITLLEITRGVARREKLSDEEYLELVNEVSGLSCKAAAKHIAKLYPQSAVWHKDKIVPLNEEQSLISFVAQNDLVDQLEEVRGILPYDTQATLGELFSFLVSDYLQRNHPEEKAKRAQKRKEQKEQKAKSLGPVNKEEDVNGNPDSAKNVQTNSVEKPIATVKMHSAPSNDRVAPQSLRNELILQDGFICSYVDPITQKKCWSKAHLEVHHRHSYSKGGETSLANSSYLCKIHHKRLSFLEFGDASQYFRPNTEGH